MRRTHRTLTFLALIATAGSVAGCSFSDSSESISKSISSPFISSSRSSDTEGRYRDDVRDVTAASLQSGGNVSQLRAQLTKVATDHGVSDWETDQATYVGIGAGLAKAGYRQVQVDTFIQNFATTPDQGKWIQQGFADAEK